MATQFAIETIDVNLPLLGQQRLELASGDSGGTRSTILIGRNGSGKSTILREIAMALRAYFSADKPRSRQGRDRVARIGVLADGLRSSLDLQSSAKIFKEEREVLAEGKRGPRRLIALSFTPFDKFPPADDSYRRGREDHVDPFYIYLGFKSDFRSMSPRGRLLRSIDQLAFQSPDELSDKRIEDILGTIGYGPVLEISYELDIKRTRDDPHSGWSPARLEEIAEMLAVQATPNRPRGRRQLHYRIDFISGHRELSAPLDPEEVRRLTRSNILRLVSITLARGDERVELLELSSGELNILSGFLGLAGFLEDGSLILVDEPENSLHPEWQIRYSDMLDAVLRQYKGCHLIVATHSPLIVSGVADGRATILRLDQEPIAVPSEIVTDSSPDATLLNAFDVVTSGNNYLKQLIVELLGLIEGGEEKSKRARTIASVLADTEERIPGDDPIQPLVAELVEAVLG